MSPTPSGRKLGQLERLPVSELRGVGNRKRAALESMGISTVLDLLTHYPRRYADRTNAVSVAELVPGDVGVVSATVRQVSLRRLRGRRSIVEAQVDDGTGAEPPAKCSYVSSKYQMINIAALVLFEEHKKWHDYFVWGA